MANHPRIIGVDRVYKGKKFFGWNVIYHGRIVSNEPRVVTRTHTKDGKRKLARPVQEIIRVDVPHSGEVSRIVRRRATLRKMGVNIIP